MQSIGNEEDDEKIADLISFPHIWQYALCLRCCFCIRSFTVLYLPVHFIHFFSTSQAHTTQTAYFPNGYTNCDTFPVDSKADVSEAVQFHLHYVVL